MDIDDNPRVESVRGFNVCNSRFSCLVIFLVFSLVIAVLSFFIYTKERDQTIREKHREISAIGELKASQIKQWRRQQIYIVEILVRSPFLLKAVGDFVISGENSPYSDDLADRLNIVKEVFDYTDVLIVDTSGVILLYLADDLHELNNETRKTVKTALELKTSVLSDLYVCSNDSIHLDAVAAFLGPDSLPVALLILRNNAEEYLYPSIQAWPTPSRTGEVILIRKENDEIVFLNHLRLENSRPLNLKFPLDSSGIPSVQAVLGRKGVFMGHDYSGNEVLADLRPIDGSPWFIVTKIDSDEVFSELNKTTFMWALLTLTCIFLAGVVSFFIYKSKQAGLLKRAVNAQKVLLKREEEFKAILESMQEGLITVDNKDVILFVNPKFCEMTGYSKDELIGKTGCKFLLNKQDIERVLKYNKERQSGKTGRYELNMIKKSGEQITFIMNAAPLNGPGGEVIGSLSTCLDISEQKKMAKSLKEGESKYRMLVESMQEGLLFADNDDVIQFINPILCKKLGYEKEELLGKYGLEILLNKQTEELVRQHTQKRLAGISDQYDIELVKKNGEKIFFITNASPLKDLDGKVIGSIATFLDITERKKAENEIKNARAQLISIFDGIDQPIYVSDPDTYEILYVNKAAKTIFGDCEGKKCYEYFQNYKSPCTFCTNEMIFGKHLGKSYIWQFQNKINGRWYNCTDKAIKWYDGSMVRYEIASDITDLKEALEKTKETEAKYIQAQKMEAVGRLAGGIAHDFNNMLAVISGNAELMLAKSDINEIASDSLREILKASEHSTNLVKQLLAFARKQTVEPEEVNLNEIIHNMLSMLKRLIGENINLIWKPAENLWRLKVDPAQIDQIVANLVINSSDSITGKGTITIMTANCEFEDGYEDEFKDFHPGKQVMLSISDDGCGMDKEIREHLFEPFFTTKPKGKGTGLGLSMIYGIVKQNSGFINVYSEPGKGTNVKIYLPRHDSQKTVKPKPAPVEKCNLTGKTILLVEDEESLLNLNLRILNLCGYKSLSAINPLQALEIAQTYDGIIDLLISDVVMPDMSGQELWERISVIRPETKCLFISGYTADIIDDHGIIKEGIHFLQKPFNKDNLSEKIREILSE